jgi:hypothetical protein
MSKGSRSRVVHGIEGSEEFCTSAKSMSGATDARAGNLLFGLDIYEFQAYNLQNQCKPPGRNAANNRVSAPRRLDICCAQ